MGAFKPCRIAKMAIPLRLTRRNHVPTTKKRKVYYSRIVDGNKPVVFDVRAAIQGVASIDRKKGPEVDDDNVWMQMVRKPNNHKVALIRLRKRNLPKLYNDKRDERVIDIKDDEGLGEKTHLFITHDGWIAHEFNQNGPRIEELTWFLSKSAGWNASWQMKRAVLSDPFTKLGEAGMAAFRINLPTVLIPEVKNIDETLYRAFSSTEELSGGDEIEITVTHRNGRSKDKKIINTEVGLILKKIVRMATGWAHVKCNAKVVDATANSEKWIDLISEHISSEIRFIRQVRTRPCGSRKCVARRIPGRGSRRLGVGAS